MKKNIGFKKGNDFSTAVISGEVIYISGQGPVREGGEIPEDFKGQARTVFENIKKAVEEAGGSMNNLIKVNVYLSDIKNFKDLNEIYREYIPEPRPVRTTIQAFLVNDFLIEADATLSLN